MCAPNLPVATVAPAPPQCLDHGGDERLGDRGGRGRVPGRAAALAGVGVQGELADHQQLGAGVRRGPLAVEDPQRVHLLGELVGPRRVVVVGDPDEYDEAGPADPSDHLAVDVHRRLADALHHCAHEV